MAKCMPNFWELRNKGQSREDIKVIIYRIHKRFFQKLGFLAFSIHVQFLKSFLKFFPKTVLPNTNKWFSFL